MGYIGMKVSSKGVEVTVGYFVAAAKGLETTPEIEVS
jgi:hypothetical protein